jgi:hypothetical protein
VAVRLQILRGFFLGVIATDNEELQDLYSSPRIIRVIKSRILRCMEHVEEAYTGFCWEKLMERDHLDDSCVDGRISVWWKCRKWDVGVWTGLSWLRIETGGGHL